MRRTGISYHKWTPQDDKILIFMTQHGAKTSVIAFLLGVSPEAVKQRRRTLRKKESGKVNNQRRSHLCKT